MKFKVCLLLLLVFTTAVKANEIASRSNLDWYNALREVSIGLSGQIPLVGGYVSILLGMFWPEGQEDIWSTMSENVEKLIDKKILEYEINQRKSEIEGIRKSLRGYNTNYVIRSSSDRGTLLNSIRVQCDQVQTKFLQSPNDIHMVKLTITFAYIHLTVLKEYYENGPTLFHDFNAQNAKNIFETTILEYKKHFEELPEKWSNWRNNLIEAKWWNKQSTIFWIIPWLGFTAMGEVVDKLVSDSPILSWQDSSYGGATAFKQKALANKERIFNQYKGEFMQILSQTFDLEKRIPGYENNLPTINPSIATVDYGPFQIDMTLNAPSWDAPGELVQIYVREQNQIDGLQFKYITHDGSYVGGDGGQEHEIHLNSRNVTGITFGMGSGVILAMQFHFSDGYKTDMYGGRAGLSAEWFKAGFISTAWRLSSVSMITGFGPNVKPGIKEIRFRFQHKYIDPATDGPNTNLDE